MRNIAPLASIVITTGGAEALSHLATWAGGLAVASRLMNCVVTGGAGFIGSHLVDALMNRGDTVTVFDDLSSGKRSNLESALRRGAILHAADVRDEAATAALLGAARPEVVFHLAAQVDVRYSVAEARQDAVTNVLGTITVLEAARAAGARRVVFSSTGGAIYGDAGIIPTPETEAIRAVAPYGQSKYAAEGYCDLYARTKGLSTVSLRYGNVYGPRQDTDGEAGVVAIFAGALAEGRRPTVFGDGRQTRDWIEVSDVVRANLLAVESGLTGAVNIGSGVETSVLELVELLGRVIEAEERPEVTFAPPREGEVQRSCLDSTRAHRELGWAAQVELAEGVRRVVNSR